MNKYVIFSESNDPFFNLAAEEYFVRNFDFSESEYLFIYKNTPSIVLGKNQNVYKEVHLDFIKNPEIPICRRISGGGTVVHDLGNINFAFLEKQDIKRVNTYHHTVGFLVEAMNAMDIACSMNSRNAIILENDLKVSGSAQFSSSNGILSHFTLLFNSDLDFINRCISQNSFSIKTKASESVRSQIGNVGAITHLSELDFINKIVAAWGTTSYYELKDDNIKSILSMKIKQYETFEWIYDKAGDAVLEFKNGMVIVKNGFISKIEQNGNDITNPFINKRFLSSEIDDFEGLIDLLDSI
jgi:lipoate-protein ligase A